MRIYRKGLTLYQKFPKTKSNLIKSNDNFQLLRFTTNTKAIVKVAFFCLHLHRQSVLLLRCVSFATVKSVFTSWGNAILCHSEPYL